MATYQLNGITISIDDRLKKRLDEDIIPDLKKKDMDVVFCVSGHERYGKSTFGIRIGGYFASQLGSKFDLTNICMNPNEFRTRIENANKNEVIVYDEAHRGLASSRALSEVNHILKDLMMEMGQMNLCVIVILPSFFLLDKYIALWRTRGLFHIYKLRGKRGFWVYFNEKQKQYLYIRGKKYLNYDCVRWPEFRGRFGKKIPINEVEYKEKKSKSFKERERYSRIDELLYERNVFIVLARKNSDLSQEQLVKQAKEYGVNLDDSTISKIESEMKWKRMENTKNY